MHTNEYLIEALEFKMSYDKSVLELTEIEIPELCGLDPAAIDTAISTGVLSYKQVGEGQITNYAEDPIALLHFKVSADASGEIPVKNRRRYKRCSSMLTEILASTSVGI